MQSRTYFESWRLLRPNEIIWLPHNPPIGPERDPCAKRPSDERRVKAEDGLTYYERGWWEVISRRWKFRGSIHDPDTVATVELYLVLRPWPTVIKLSESLGVIQAELTPR